MKLLISAVLSRSTVGLALSTEHLRMEIGLPALIILAIDDQELTQCVCCMPVRHQEQKQVVQAQRWCNTAHSLTRMA